MAISMQDLLRHQEWADAVFFRAWEASGAQADTDLRTRMDHTVATTEAFLAVFQGGLVAFPEHPLPDFEALKARCVAAHRILADLTAGWDEAALDRPVRIPWFPDPPCVVPVSEALLQVCLHSQHHRGQCLASLRALGAAPKNIDYLIWLWRGRPEPRWT